MIIDLSELNYKKSIDINYDVKKDDELDKRIIDLKDAKVVGSIYKDSNEDIYLDVEFKGKMIILDSISLKEVPYEFAIKIDEGLEEIEENYFNCYENTKNMQKALDLKQILWQNIVLEVPMSYTVIDDANLKGDGWELINDSNRSKESIDPRLKKLEDLLKGDD